jgi:tetratricopeptide (TPR) repeat protein
MKYKRERTITAQLHPAKAEGKLLPALMRSSWRIYAALLVIALVAYADSFRAGLALDSRVIITEDVRIREVNAENLKLILAKDYWWPKAGDWLYRPVTTASLLANYAVFGNGENAAGYHWINFLLHCGNICLVYALALRLLGRAGPAFFAAALWGVHPLGTECVTNIIGRADLLAAMAVCGGLLLYLRSTTMQGWRLRAAAAALFAIAAAGVFSKENAAVLIGVMLLWDISFGIGEWRSATLRRAPAYAAVAGSLGVLWWARHTVFQGLPWPQPLYLDNPLRGAGFWPARLTALKVVGLDLWLLAFPLSLSSDRSYNQIPLAGGSDPSVWLAMAAIAGILAVALASYRRHPLVFWLAGFLGITLLPTSNLLFPIGTIMAERFLYLPAMAFGIALVAFTYRFAGQRRAAAMLAVLTTLYAGRTLARNLDWKDNLTLASSDVRTAPESARLHDMLAKALFEQDNQRNIDKAIREQERALTIFSPLPATKWSEMIPAHLGIYYAVKANMLGSPANAQSRPGFERSLAVLLRAREISRASEQAFDRAQIAHGKPLSVRPAFQLLYFYLASDYLNLGRWPEALEALRYGRNLDPRFLPAYDDLAIAYVGAGEPEWAGISLLEKAQMDGFSPAMLAAIRDFYTRVPEGACAVEEQGGALQFNVACPRLRKDLCLASVDLTQAFLEARASAQAREVRDTAMQSYGCPASQFESALANRPSP